MNCNFHNRKLGRLNHLKEMRLTIFVKDGMKGQDDRHLVLPVIWNIIIDNEELTIIHKKI